MSDCQFFRTAAPGPSTELCRSCAIWDPQCGVFARAGRGAHRQCTKVRGKPLSAAAIPHKIELLQPQLILAVPIREHTEPGAPALALVARSAVGRSFPSRTYT